MIMDLAIRKKLAVQRSGIPLKPKYGLTPISCHAVLERSACAPFIKERRMKCINATNLRRKSGQVGHPASFSQLAQRELTAPTSNLNFSQVPPLSTDVSLPVLPQSRHPACPACRGTGAKRRDLLVSFLSIQSGGS